MNALADQLDLRRDELARRSILRMYADDPFWERRFGDRGRTYALEDGARHVQYLAAALRANDAAPLVEYAQWLQRVLTTRGMCTHHLATNFTRLADLLKSDGLDADGAAARLLADARAGLVYAADPARALQRLAGQVTRGADERTIALYDFLCDAVAMRSSEVLGRHVAWLADAGGWPEAPEALAALVEAVRSAAPELAGACATLADEARRAVDAR